MTSLFASQSKMMYSIVALPALITAAIGGGVFITTAVAADLTSELWNFDKDAAGARPEHWIAAETNGKGTPGQWKVTPDDSAPSKPNILHLTTANAAETFNICVRDDMEKYDVDLSVSLRPDGGEIDAGGGVVWRYQNEKNYYVARVNPLESNYRVYKVLGGERIKLESADVIVDMGKWITLRIVHVGHRIECHLNGEKLLTTTDYALNSTGKVGLWTKADASTSFDDLRLAPVGK